MLVGALAYAMPERQELWLLIPAFFGVVIALLGAVAMRCDRLRKMALRANVALAIFVLVSAALKVAMLWALGETAGIPMMANVDLLVLSGIFLHYAIKSFLEAKVNGNTSAKN